MGIVKNISGARLRLLRHPRRQCNLNQLGGCGWFGDSVAAFEHRFDAVDAPLLNERDNFFQGVGGSDASGQVRDMRAETGRTFLNQDCVFHRSCPPLMPVRLKRPCQMLCPDYAVASISAATGMWTRRASFRQFETMSNRFAGLRFQWLLTIVCILFYDNPAWRRLTDTCARKWRRPRRRR